MDLRELRNQIIYKLYQYMELPIVPQDQIQSKPAYPYMTYKFIVPYNQFNHQGDILQNLVPSTDDRFEYDIEETLKLQVQMTISLNVYCKGEPDSQMVAYEIAKKAMGWFKHVGYQDLSDLNVVVVNIEAFGDRTVLIVDDYEARVGFDVILRTTDTIKRRIETIETWDIDIKEG